MLIVIIAVLYMIAVYLTIRRGYRVSSWQFWIVMAIVGLIRWVLVSKWGGK
jgi:hypothetical protein